MGDSESDQSNRWQSIKQILKASLRTEIVICVLCLVLAATLFPGQFRGLRFVIGHLWLLIMAAVLVLISIAYGLMCFWEFISGNDADKNDQADNSRANRQKS